MNETYGEACLEVAEELANQTPVRLDLLLSLLPSATNGDVVGGKLDTSIVSVHHHSFIFVCFSLTFSLSSLWLASLACPSGRKRKAIP